MNGVTRPLLAVDHLRVGYRDLIVVPDLSLQLTRGELLGITGRNGAGKSTTMMCLAGILRSDSGEIRLDGVELSRRRPWQRAAAGLALIPEGKRVVREMSVADNLRLGRFSAPRAQRSPRATSARIDDVLETFPALAGRLSSLAGSLSGGQQQMLAIAQGLMGEPQVLIVDEPSSGLAPLVVDEVLAGLRSYADAGHGVVVVEQQIDRVAAYSDGILVLEAGNIAWSGPADSSGLHDIVHGIVFGRRDAGTR